MIRSVRITVARPMVGRSGVPVTSLQSAVVTTGAPGDRGERGPKGERGDQGPTGAPAVRWLGDYSEATPYLQGDGVSASDGLLYICAADCAGVDPVSDTAHRWMCLRDLVADSAA